MLSLSPLQLFPHPFFTLRIGMKDSKILSYPYKVLVVRLPIGLRVSIKNESGDSV